MANDVWAGLLCYRNDRDNDGPIRPGAIRRGSIQAFAATSRPDDRVRNRNQKDGPQVVRLYNQMAEPKYVIAMGACAISGGPFKQGYNVLKGIDRYIPVDVHIPGCPPRPEALIDAFMTLQRKIDEQALTGSNKPRHLDPDAPSEFVVPRYSAHDLDPPSNPHVWHILNNIDSCATGEDDAGED